MYFHLPLLEQDSRFQCFVFYFTSYMLRVAWCNLDSEGHRPTWSISQYNFRCLLIMTCCTCIWVNISLLLIANYSHMHIWCKLIMHKVVFYTPSWLRKSWNGVATVITLSFYNIIFFRCTTWPKPKNDRWREDGANKTWVLSGFQVEVLVVVCVIL